MSDSVQSEILSILMHAKERVFERSGLDLDMTIALPSDRYERLLAECIGIQSPLFSTEFWYGNIKFVRKTR